jgi:hypothetical protein
MGKLERPLTWFLGRERYEYMSKNDRYIFLVKAISLYNVGFDILTAMQLIL